MIYLRKNFEWIHYARCFFVWFSKIFSFFTPFFEKLFEIVVKSFSVGGWLCSYIVFFPSYSLAWVFDVRY